MEIFKFYAELSIYPPRVPTIEFSPSGLSFIDEDGEIVRLNTEEDILLASLKSKKVILYSNINTSDVLEFFHSMHLPNLTEVSARLGRNALDFIGQVSSLFSSSVKLTLDIHAKPATIDLRNFRGRALHIRCPGGFAFYINTENMQELDIAGHQPISDPITLMPDRVVMPQQVAIGRVVGDLDFTYTKYLTLRDTDMLIGGPKIKFEDQQFPNLVYLNISHAMLKEAEMLIESPLKVLNVSIGGYIDVHSPVLEELSTQDRGGSINISDPPKNIVSHFTYGQIVARATADYRGFGDGDKLTDGIRLERVEASEHLPNGAWQLVTEPLTSTSIIQPDAGYVHVFGAKDGESTDQGQLLGIMTLEEIKYIPALLNSVKMSHQDFITQDEDGVMHLSINVTITIPLDIQDYYPRLIDLLIWAKDYTRRRPWFPNDRLMLGTINQISIFTNPDKEQIIAALYLADFLAFDKFFEVMGYHIDTDQLRPYWLYH